ncbi:2-oxo-4-hydroxy-4-carboxy-5-ureidoimidazoline decarboxylase [Streptomonospora wellingtoniae]|uniref:2-oxo-4-hydroxy-4-carboxy-5-ureidoimidazoline decarboxylase n=1 Tax=Streptomonospora wellingtoniae TaxID=3075544 RepID=A0ABU2KS39_9ACTN|nr:2-oxo-4-hydroxy-4-carboxy-5-ureidoimidazoline decarboxylase [Streptomonospora sp. DSM 45055]MDT0302102.1 2-oxo-4-hydroxy-4-carboxy-5-ureidoimidazoline decarboxylase [Streptomonospora sp. DSM 45055]
MPDDTAVQSADAGLARVNALAPEEFRAEFGRCLEVDRWVEGLHFRRPFGSRSELLDAADRIARTLTEDEVAAALARHPRIGEPAGGAETEAGWSRGEQSGFTAAEAGLRERFAAVQADYERRFDRIYLVCAANRSARELLDDLTARMGNDAATEERVVAGELRRIALQRVGKVLDS